MINLLKAAFVMATVMGFFWLIVEAVVTWKKIFGKWAMLSAVFVFGTLMLWAGSE